ncbi:hypothetical protein VTO42DRAFT_608 [Malbranchea cinnamomea]
MGFKFSYVCDLLSQLESNRVLKAASGARKIDPDTYTVTRWFDRHQKQIHDGSTDRLALLSCLFPEKRVDRVYGLREPSLVKVIGRCLLLGASRKQELDLWRERGGGDLGQCVENVMRQAENHLNGLPEVTVEEIDHALAQIASNCRFSGPNVRRSHSAVTVDDALAPIFRRLKSHEGKWLTRLVLKDFSPVIVPTQLVLKTFHFFLPTLLVFQDSLEAALEILSREPIKSFPPRPSHDFAIHLMQNVMTTLTPKLGVKIGRPDFYKARTLKHCCTMAGKRKMSLERKYDGEYCQIHIDLSKGKNCVQIFSKSGKDSTEDRREAHRAIKTCLRIGTTDCAFSERCILEGEMLVWGGEQSGILPFYKIRKHVSRSGSFIGTENDSPPHQDERLYIVFFDVLLVDDDVCLSKSYTERRRLLSEIVKPTKGLGSLAEQENINFALPDAFERLKDIFSAALAHRWEGLVLKGCDEPYFTLKQYTPGDYSGHWIKLKKEYIPGLGDTADFAVIGARYDSRDTANLQNVRPLFWTSFFIGCLDRPHFSGSSKPVFRVVDVLNRLSMTVEHLQFLNQHGQFYMTEFCPDNIPFIVKVDQVQLPSIEVIFKKPFVVDLVGFGFERPPNVRYFTLRFPRIVKIHSDRTFRDATSFEHLQRLAETARSVPADELSQEMTMWAARLDPTRQMSDYIVDHSGSSSSFMVLNNDANLSDSDVNDTNLADVIVPSIKQAPQQLANVQFHVSKPEKKQMSVTESAWTHLKKRKFSAQSAQAITVLPGHSVDTSTSAKNASSSRDFAGHYLTNLVNIPATRSHRSDSSENGSVSASCSISQQSMLGSENISKVNRGNRTSTSVCPLESHRSNTCLSTISNTGELCVHVGEKRLAFSQPLFFNAHIMISSSLYKSVSNIQKGLAKSGRSVTTSTTEFIHSLSGVKSTVASSDFSATCIHGIVLVDSSMPQAAEIASEIAKIGNALVSRQRAHELTGVGKVLFLHWEDLCNKILDGTNETSANDWEKVLKRSFAGCLKWGYDIPRKRQKRIGITGVKNETRSHGAARSTDTTGDITDAERGRGYAVAASWDWRESLSLLHKTG